MEYEIVELEDYSGEGCTIYSVIPKGHSQTLFDRFIAENWADHQIEVVGLIENLITIGAETGMREKYYKPNEGRLGDNIGAMYVQSGVGLRLFFIRYGTDVIILGGGGFKGAGTRAWQDDAKLTNEMELLIRFSKHSGERLRMKDDLRWSDDLRYIEGELKNYGDEEEP